MIHRCSIIIHQQTTHCNHTFNTTYLTCCISYTLYKHDYFCGEKSRDGNNHGRKIHDFINMNALTFKSIYKLILECCIFTLVKTLINMQCIYPLINHLFRRVYFVTSNNNKSSRICTCNQTQNTSINNTADESKNRGESLLSNVRGKMTVEQRRELNIVVAGTHTCSWCQNTWYNSGFKGWSVWFGK